MKQKAYMSVALYNGHTHTTLFHVDLFEVDGGMFLSTDRESEKDLFLAVAAAFDGEYEEDVDDYGKPHFSIAGIPVEYLQGVRAYRK